MLPLPLLGFLLLGPPPSSPAFLPRPVQSLFQDLGQFLEGDQETPGKDEQTFDYSVDFRQLPPNYHNEEHKERKVGNATVFSHSRIDKVTNNQTGESVISQNTFTSIKQGDRGLSHQWKGCHDADDCQRDQYCHSFFLASECRDCKVKSTECRRDGECCLGYLCVWGRCSDGVAHGENGTSCNPQQDTCVKGLCCTSRNILSRPVCTPLPGEGQECWSPSSRLLGRIGGGLAARAWWESCSCAPGLVCTQRRFNPVSTCQRLERGLHFAEVERASFLQPILRRHVEFDYDNAGPLPWQLADGQLTVLDLPRATEEREGDAEDFGQRLTAKLVDGWEDKNLSMDDNVGDPDSPSPLDFQQLKELATQMGQYFGPDFS